jgi:ribokinase
LADATLKLADFITPNETELEVLAGREIKGTANLKRIAGSLLYRADQTVIITLGAKGAMYVQHERSGIVPGHKVTAVDTTGAGDAFNGSFAVAIAENRGLEQALDFANAAAALCVTKYGTAPSMPYRQDVEKFLRQVRP